MRAALLIFAIAGVLAGCRGEFEFLRVPPPPPSPLTILQPGQIVREPDGEDIEAAPAAPMCQARARFFRGTVQIPCVDIARTVAP